MCTYSMIAKEWFPNGPNDPHPYDYTPSPVYPNMIPWNTVTPDLAKELLEILNKVEALDKKLKKVECKLEGEEKAVLVAKLEEIAKDARK